MHSALLFVCCCELQGYIFCYKFHLLKCALILEHLIIAIIINFEQVINAPTIYNNHGPKPPRRGGGKRIAWTLTFHPATPAGDGGGGVELQGLCLFIQQIPDGPNVTYFFTGFIAYS